jgi:hypothetical protein
MQMLRERHHLSREALKDVLIRLIDEYGFGNVVDWNNFAFEGKSKKTTVRGEIFENELHIEVEGWFEKLAAQKLRSVWKSLILRGIV